MDCRLKLDGENLGVFKAGEPRKVKTSLGQHILEATSVEGNYRWRQTLTVDKVGQMIVQPELLTQKQQAEATERSQREAAQQEARLQQMKAQETREMTALADRARRDGFVQIPSGKFEMGSNNGDADEKPVHQVIITKWFEMGKYEVTQAQWEAVTGNNPSRFKGANLPVENVSWNDVQAFISSLNARSNDGYIYRLPTEAEWEYACRAGTTGDYAGSLYEMAWYEDNSGGKTHPVGTKQPNAWGLYDMHGNVWEWCADWKGSYESGTATDPRGPSSGSARVSRGGGWFHPAAICRSAFRDSLSPGSRGGHLGFRLVRSAR
jgi:formylglycine-generating enzyme required for sulfatase activity